MNVDRAREFLGGLPHAVETMQWGANLVFWVGDKAIGGKMFALIDLDGDLAHGVAMFAAGPERFAELVEQDGMIPARYLARAHWVAAERWSALRERDWESELAAAHAIVLARLPRKTLDVLAMPERERAKIVRERRKLLEAKAAADLEKKEASKKRRPVRKARS